MEGKFGPLVANLKAAPGKKTCRIRSDATGVVVRAVDAKKWLVKRDQDDECVNARSCILTVIDTMTGIPVNDITKEVSLYKMCTYYMLVF